SDLTLRDMPAEGLPPSLAKNPAELTGRVLLTQVAKGQVIPESLLAPKGSLGGLAATVPDGKRAITLEVNEVSGVAGMLTPRAHEKLTGGRGITVAELRGEGDREALSLISHLFLGGQKGGATTKPIEPVNSDTSRPMTRNYRNVEVIRGGASSTVRLGMPPRSETLTGGADKLLGEVPLDR